MSDDPLPCLSENPNCSCHPLLLAVHSSHHPPLSGLLPSYYSLILTIKCSLVNNLLRTQDTQDQTHKWTILEEIPSNSYGKETIQGFRQPTTNKSVKVKTQCKQNVVQILILMVVCINHDRNVIMFYPAVSISKSLSSQISFGL